MRSRVAPSRTSISTKLVKWLPWLALACTQHPSAETASPASAAPAAEASEVTAGPPSSAKFLGAQESTVSQGSTPTENSGIRIRPAALAGSWYPEDRAWAISEMRQLYRLARSAPTLESKARALVLPHAGWRYSGAAVAAAMRTLRPRDYSRVVLIGPSHTSAFRGFALPPFDAFHTPVGEIPICRKAASLRDGKLIRALADADRGEHSLEIELPWLEEALGSFCLVPLLVGQTDRASERALADRLAPLWDENTLFVVSSDFVHYGERFDYTPFGVSAKSARNRVFDLENRVIGKLAKKDADGLRQLVTTTGATVCGYRGLLVLLELLSKVAPEAAAVPLAHYSSVDLKDVPGQESSVGYVSLAFVDRAPSVRAVPMAAPRPSRSCGSNAPKLDPGVGQQLVELARATLETELRGSNELWYRLAAMPPSQRIDCQQAVFVTLKEGGQLRGCVGQVEPQYPLLQAVVRSSLDAALHDRRFDPVSREELDRLSVEVTVLTVPRPIPAASEIRLGVDGVILSARGRRALFLPQVATEQGWNLRQMLQALSEKAGLLPDAWSRDDARFSVFTGQVFSEAEARVPQEQGTRR